MQTLLHSPSEVVRQVLVDLGLATLPATPQPRTWPAYVGFEPDGVGVPDDVVTVYDTQGSGGARSMADGGSLFGNYGVQIRFRSTEHRTGWRKADEVQTTLAEHESLAATEGRIVTVTDSDGTETLYALFAFVGIGDVLRIGQEPGGRRCLFTLNAQVVLDNYPATA